MATSKDKKTTGEAKPTASSGTKKTTVTQSNATASTLPSAEALKERFKAGSIPLQTDFSDLIDIANVGRMAVGDNSTGWGLEKDSSNRLQYNPRSIIELSYDLSPCKTQNELFVLNEGFAGDVAKNNKTAFLALHYNVGPASATNIQNGSYTTFKLPAIKIDSSGKRTNVTISITAEKAVGVNGERWPFEYINGGSSSYSMWYSFRLDTATDDFTNCTLSINPLMLACYYIPEFSEDSAGELLSVLKVNFVYNSSREIIPAGLIAMFSGTTVPDGWALCDGSNNTPDLVDRFILGGNLSDAKKVNSAVMSGEPNNKLFKTATTDESTGITVQVQPHQLTVDEMPKHYHTLKTIGGNTFYLDSGVDFPIDGHSKTDSAGGDQPHNHESKVSDNKHSHEVNVIPPYYILAFIIKL